jgi:hypothetical protein
MQMVRFPALNLENLRGRKFCMERLHNFCAK